MAYHTITIKGTGVRQEFTAAGTITPGMLVEITTAGKVQAHSTAGGNAARIFAVEDDIQGNDIADDYSADNKAQVNTFLPGDEVYALLNDGETVSIGHWLESAGNGKLQRHQASSAGAVEYPEAIVAVAKEAVDMSGSSGEDPSGRIIVEIV